MSTPGKAHRNTRTSGSAAAHCGIIGLPEPASRTRRGDGGLRIWCRECFLPAFDRFVERRGLPELKHFNATESALFREFR